MHPYFSLVGFHLIKGYRFRIGNRKFFLQAGGIRAVRLIVEILDASKERKSLFPMRAEIRAIRAALSTATITHVIQSSKVERVQLVAIWLRGQCGGHIGTEVIERFAGHRSERLRRAVAKSLRRMNASNILNQMASHDPSERVRRLASPRIAAEFGLRLRTFKRDVKAIPVSPSTPPLYISPLVRLSEPIRVKSAELIREILQRIQQLVHRSVGVYLLLLLLEVGAASI